MSAFFCFSTFHRTFHLFKQRACITLIIIRKRKCIHLKGQHNYYHSLGENMPRQKTGKKFVDAWTMILWKSFSFNLDFLNFLPLCGEWETVPNIWQCLGVTLSPTFRDCSQLDLGVQMVPGTEPMLLLNVAPAFSPLSFLSGPIFQLFYSETLTGKESKLPFKFLGYFFFI